jgi:hypothetical protein
MAGPGGEWEGEEMEMEGERRKEAGDTAVPKGQSAPKKGKAEKHREITLPPSPSTHNTLELQREREREREREARTGAAGASPLAAVLALLPRLRRSALCSAGARNNPPRRSIGLTMRA